MTDNIFREPTPEEAKDMIDITKKRKVDPFIQQCLNEEQQMGETKELFCRRCAMIDYNDYKENLAKEALRGGHNKLVQPSVFDYKDKNRFKLLKTRTITSTKYKGGPTMVTEFFDYRCKIRGCGISLEGETMSKEEYDKKTQNRKTSGNK